MRRTLSSAALVAFVVLANAATAMAQSGGGSDPKQVGDHVKGIVSANAKAFWWVLLVVGVLSMIATRKTGRAVATGVALVISGIAIYNPGGVGSMMSSLANEIVG